MVSTSMVKGPLPSTETAAADDGLVASTPTFPLLPPEPLLAWRRMSLAAGLRRDTWCTASLPALSPVTSSQASLSATRACADSDLRVAGSTHRALTGAEW